MGFRRRHDPPQVTEREPEPEAVEHELCAFCGGEIALRSRHGNSHIIALLVDVPGEPPYALSHRHCAERARGWVRI
jgi:hypothetical protein